MKRLLVTLLAAASAVAQSVIDYSKLPQCAHQCSILQQAEASCVPPAAPVTNQGIYQSCVCQSALLTTLHSSGSLCSTTNAVCSADDANKISQYYVALCNGPVVQPQPSSTLVTTTSAAATTTSTTGTATAAGAGANAHGVSNTSPGNNSWFSTHWKWVVMVIVIFVAIVVLWVGGIFLRRHFDRKKDAERANLAAKDAPYNPPTPGSKSATANTTVASPPMTMSGGRGGMAMDAGVGGIAPPRGPPRMRSRTDTLSSLGLGNASKSTLPRPTSQGPVVWGPHQHLANVNGNNSPSGSIPPSPTLAITPPNPMFRNREAASSEPRFVHYRTTPTSITPETIAYGSAHGNAGHVEWSAADAGDDVIRPHTTGREEGVIGKVASHTLSSAKSDPVPNPSLQGQSAEILQATPKKLHKRPE